MCADTFSIGVFEFQLIFKGFESYKDVQTPRDHRVLSGCASSTEWVWDHNLYIVRVMQAVKDDN